MPFIQANLSIELNDNQKNDLQEKLSNAVSSAFSKPTAYIMSEISCGKSLYMGGKKLEKGAYISIKLLPIKTSPSNPFLTPYP